jgi:hypothetical protein
MIVARCDSRGLQWRACAQGSRVQASGNLLEIRYRRALQLKCSMAGVYVVEFDSPRICTFCCGDSIHIGHVLADLTGKTTPAN